MMEQYTENTTLQAMFSVPFLQGVIDLLKALGYTFQDSDSIILTFTTQRVNEEILNSCNVSRVPNGLYQCATGLIVAEFLMTKKNMGQVDGLTLNFEPVLKSLQEGDTNIVWATDVGQSPEQRFDTFIGYLLAGRTQFVSYRRLKW